MHNGVKPVWSSEIEKFPLAVTKIRFPNTVQLGDVTKIDGGKIPPVDIICSGSPCQSFSVAGKRDGMQGESGLFRDFVRIVRQMKEATSGKYPKWVIWENVPGVFSSTDGKDIVEVLESFDRLGYVLDMNVLDAQYMGVPQRRRRIFVTWLNVETLRQMKTPLYVSIITQCLVELLASILIGKLSLSIKELEKSGLNQKNLSEDGLLKKMRLFGIVERQQFEKLLQDWNATLQNYMIGQGNLDVLLDRLTEEQQQEGMTKSELIQKLEKEPFGNTDTLWSNFLDDLYKKKKSFTILTETSEITEKTICTCAKILENINWLMIRLPGLWKYWLQMEQYVLNVRKVCINYVEQGQTGTNLFESMEWLQYWDDYISTVSEKRVLSLADFAAGRRCAGEILFERQSLPGDSEQGKEERQGTAADTEKSAGDAGGGIYDIRISSDGTQNWRAHCYETDKCRSLDTHAPDPDTNHGGVAILEDDAMVFDYRKAQQIEHANTLDISCRSCMGKQNATVVVNKGFDAYQHHNWREGDTPLVLNDQGGGVMNVEKKTIGTLRAESHGHPPIVFENHAQDSRIKEVAVCPAINAKAGTGGNNLPIVMTQGSIPEKPDIGAAGFKAGQSRTGGLGYEEEKAATLSAHMSGLEPTVVTYCIAANTIDRQVQNGGNGKGVLEEKAYTLNTVDRHAVAQAMSTTGGADVDYQQRKFYDKLDGKQGTYVDGNRLERCAYSCNGKQIVGSLCAHDGRGFNGQDVSNDKLIIEVANESV